MSEVSPEVVVAVAPEAIAPTKVVATVDVEPTKEAIVVAPQQNWLASIALKKVGWAVTKIIAAKIAGYAAAPGAAAALAGFNSFMGPYGVTVNVDLALFQKALPLLVFAGLVWAHDYAKVKTKLPWL